MPIVTGLLLLIGCSSMIFYVQRTLSEIEEALPITLARQERDIRVLVNDMGRLVQNIGFVRQHHSEQGIDDIIRQTDEVDAYLQMIRENYRFNDLLGVSAIHARLNPAIFDIKTWLANGIFNFSPRSPETLKLIEQRAYNAYNETEALLLQVGETAIDVLGTQAQRINAFRNIMLATLAVLAMLTILLVILGFRQQKIFAALKQSQQQIRYRANYDSLTGLPNRLNFIEHLTDAISRSQRKPVQTALMFVDLDRFKTINDTLGHDYGDELIKQVGARIREAIRRTDLVARFGGDEFTVLLTDMTNAIHASMIAKGILARLSEPFTIFGHELHSSASIGITVSPEDASDPKTLLKNADMAMYEAKEKGRNRFRFFTPRMTEHAQQFLELDKSMHRALVEDEFELLFQPIYRHGYPGMIGVEALLRWRHPTRGIVMPDEFIKVAEETGLIDEIGLWVLRRACAQAQPWLARNPSPEFFLAVNISMRQFKGGFDRKQLATILEETSFPAHCLQLEITESLLMDDDERIPGALEDFRQMGIRIALDDFGTGYSALSHLREFPVSTLKIDRSFIHEITTSNNDRRLVEAIVIMARGLGLDIIAEGVETSQQGEMLSELGCDLVQGNFYGCAMPPAEIEAAIDNNASDSSPAGASSTLTSGDAN